MTASRVTHSVALGSRFLQSDNTVEDELATSRLSLRVLVHAEIADTLKLEAVKLLRVSDNIPDACIFVLNERIVVEEVSEVAFLNAGLLKDILMVHEDGILVDDGWDSVFLRDPVDHTLNLLLGNGYDADLDLLN